MDAWSRKKVAVIRRVSGLGSTGSRVYRGFFESLDFVSFASFPVFRAYCVVTIGKGSG